MVIARLEPEGDVADGAIELGEAPVRVGSREDCDLVLRAEGVAARHFLVERTRSGWRLKDLGSGTGTLVNGTRRPVRRLRNGDRIECGEAVLHFHSERRVGKPPAPASRRTARAEHEDVRRLKTTLSALASEIKIKKLVSLIVDQVISLTGAERGFLILRGAAKKYEMVAARTLDQENVRKPSLKISRAVAEEVARTGKPLLTTNAQADARLQESESVEGMRLRSVLCLPLSARGRFLGFLYLDHRFTEAAFRHEDLDILEAFADQAAVALENARLVNELEQRTEELATSKMRVEELNRLLEERIDRQRQELDEVRTLLRDRGEKPLKHQYASIIGRSPAMRQVLELVDHVTDTAVPVLILGASGTGKELIARAIHENGPRSSKPFIAENCAAIPETLLESVLFGHVKGAFTGADRDREGLFEQADGGTLFLDEVGDIPLGMQVKLLRVLESGELRRVGGKRTLKVDVRVLSATNRDLRAMVEGGDFREDLFYRINVLEVRLPPLRERREDIPDLVRHILADHARTSGGEPKQVTDEALSLLTGYAWPGNVRQLRNELLRAVALSDQVILPEVLSDQLRSSIPAASPAELAGRSLKEIVQDAVDVVEGRAVKDALRATGWHKGEAARLLQVSRPTLDAKIKRFGIERPTAR